MAAAGLLECLGRAERNKRDKRERIVRAARELFRTKGFQATTTTEIAELADVGKGTLFFHARSKQALLIMMFQEEVGRSIERAFISVPEAPLLDQLMHVFGVMIEHNRRDLELARIFVKELAFVGGDRRGIDAVMADLFGRMSALIEQAQERGEISKTASPALLAYNLFALYFAFLVLWLGSRAPAPDPARPSLRQMLELHLSALPGMAAARSIRRRKNKPPRAADGLPR
jgi:AcrR family transcriptional regulator